LVKPKTIFKSTNEEKRKLLENHKTETLNILETINEKNSEDSITKAMQKIKEMVYSGEDVDNDIIKLHDLKKELL